MWQLKTEEPVNIDKHVMSQNSMIASFTPGFLKRFAVTDHFYNTYK